MINIGISTPVSIDEAEKILTSNCERNINDNVFDVYGNYNYPFEEKITTPNTAVGCVGKSFK